MKKILFILNYRAGTNLWHFVSGHKTVNFYASLKTKAIVNGKSLTNPEIPDPSYAYTNNWEGSQHSFFLPTVPSRICPCENYFAQDIETTLGTNPPFEYFSWHVSIGDWWGEATADQVPEPYEVITPVRFGPDELQALPGEQKDWRFIYIVRDGRNQIESLRNIPGGIEGEKSKANPKDYFIVLCKAFRNRARLALDCSKQLSNFKMVKFEDFTKDCIKTMLSIYNFAGLVLNKEFVEHAYEMTVREKITKQHSSFGSVENLHNRWNNWTPWEIETFYNIAGKELEELGYK